MYSSREETDCLPKNLHVTKLDFFVDFIGFSSYLLDLASDIWIIWYHYNKKNHLATGLLVGDFILTILLLNIISFFFWLEDYRTKKDYHHRRYFRLPGLIWRLISCLFCIAPAIFYIDSFRYAWKFHKNSSITNKVILKDSPSIGRDGERSSRLSPRGKEIYLRMLEADRDATLLRLFEAFLESAPQALIQGYFFARALQQAYLGTGPALALEFVIPQTLSFALSLVSLAWALIAQHRCLRFARQDKVNMTWMGCAVQMIWRLFTILSRVLIIIAFTLAFQHWCPIALALHFAVSVALLLIFQKLSSDTAWYLETLLIIAVSFIHLVAPFNMAEGRSRGRYLLSYGLEFAELVTFDVLCYFNDSFLFPFKSWILLGILFSFGFGICAMICYYGLFHPLRGAISGMKKNSTEV